MPNFLTTFFRREAKSQVWNVTPATWPDRYQRPHYPATATHALQTAMARNELVYACIGIKATAALDPRLIVQRKIVRKGKTSWEEVEGHPFRQLIAMDEGDLMAACITSWDCSNPRRVFIQKVFEGDRLAAYNPLNPAAMQPKWQPSTGKHIGWTFDDGYERQELSLEEVIVRRAPAWYKIAPLVPAMGTTDIDSSQTDYVRSFFANGGAPLTYLKYKSMALNDGQRDTIRQKWRSVYGNAGAGQHDIGVLDMNMDIQRVGSMLTELDSESLRNFAESRICMPFGVPPLIVYAQIGLMRSTYSNLGEAWEWFWKATMSPAFKEWRMFWTKFGLMDFEREADVRAERIRLHYDMALVDALQDNLDAVHDRTRKDWAAGIITKNEARAATGRDEVPDGNAYFQRGGTTPPPGEPTP